MADNIRRLSGSRQMGAARTIGTTTTTTTTTTATAAATAQQVSFNLGNSFPPSDLGLAIITMGEKKHGW